MRFKLKKNFLENDEHLWSPMLKRSRSDSDAESSDGERPADLNLSRLDDSDDLTGFMERSGAESHSAQENLLRCDANDYELRFCGHCNTTTDIKEANFFGRYIENLEAKILISCDIAFSEGEYIVAGSDDG